MKRAGIAIGMILIVLVIVAGIIISPMTKSRTIVRAQESMENPMAEKILEIAVERNIDGEVVSGEVEVRFEDPERLPEQGESAFGVVLDRLEDVLTLGTGSIEVEVNVEVVNDQEPLRSVNISHSGNPVAVIVTSDTVIYADVTPNPEISEADLASGSKLVKRTILPGSIESIEEGMILRVWGPVQDGVITAEFLLYESDMIPVEAD